MEALQVAAAFAGVFGIIGCFVWAMEASSKAQVAEWIEDSRRDRAARHALRSSELARWNRVDR
jgi:hypothetical protein